MNELLKIALKDILVCWFWRLAWNTKWKWLQNKATIAHNNQMNTIAQYAAKFVMKSEWRGMNVLINNEAHQIVVIKTLQPQIEVR
jgi:hypothetical protein